MVLTATEHRPMYSVYLELRVLTISFIGGGFYVGKEGPSIQEKP